MALTRGRSAGNTGGGGGVESRMAQPRSRGKERLPKTTLDSTVGRGAGRSIHLPSTIYPKIIKKERKTKTRIFVYGHYVDEVVNAFHSPQLIMNARPRGSSPLMERGGLGLALRSVISGKNETWTIRKNLKALISSSCNRCSLISSYIALQTVLPVKSLSFTLCRCNQTV